nr:uncharacterized mitochondrial protein AtMg00810-like [Tanacetum cinerariifolium]
YALESLKKYGFESCDPVDTPMVEKSKLDEDKEGKVIDPSHYRVLLPYAAIMSNTLGLNTSTSDITSSKSRLRVRIMATTVEQQVALDEALVPSAQRSPFFKAFLVTVDVPEIYMQEFWATAYVHQHSIRFKMDTRKNIVDLEAFREMLHISPRVPG